MPSRTDDKYTEPEVGAQGKEEIQAGDKEGARDQRSARKAQMMASESKKRGGGYTSEKKDDEAKHLDEQETKAADEKGSQGYTEIERKSVTDCTTHWDDPEYISDNAREFKKFQADRRRSTSSVSEDDGGKKRGRGANAGWPNKKAKSGGGKQGGPTGAAGDKTRVPQKGQPVQWHGADGYVDGQAVEVVYDEKEVEGHQVKGSKEDPRVVVRSDASGKTCVNKPEAVYFG